MKEIILSLVEQAKDFAESVRLASIKSALFTKTVESLKKAYDDAQPPVVIPDPDPVPDLPKCVKGPTIVGISDISDTSAILNFDGLGVTEVEYFLSKEKSGQSIYSGSVKPTSSKVLLSYPKQNPDSYYMNIEGGNCKSEISSRKFTIEPVDVVSPPPVIVDPGPIVTPPPANTTKIGRLIYMNCTGYGFDIHDPSGINAGWREPAEAFLHMEYKGKKFRGIDGIRVNVKWLDYEPTEGVFRDNKLIDMIEWHIQRGIRLSIALIPWRDWGDGFFEEKDMVKLLDGSIWTPNPGLPSKPYPYMPSLNSEIGKVKFARAAEHLASVMAKYPDNVDYISTATSQSEEYQLVRREHPLFISGYGDADKKAWADYSGGKPMPRPDDNTEDALNRLMDTKEGRMLYEFNTKSLRDFHAAFVRGVRKGSKNGFPRTCGMYAGIGAPSAVFDFTFELNDMFSAKTGDQPDIIYSSEGDPGTNNWKLMACDLNLGTFPGAQVACEFDTPDLSFSQDKMASHEADLNPAVLSIYGKSFLRRGGDIIHFAMAFNKDKVNQLAEPMFEIRRDFIDSDAGMTPMPEAEPVVFPITRYSGLQGYRDAWDAKGGGPNKKVLITLN